MDESINSNPLQTHTDTHTRTHKKQKVQMEEREAPIAYFFLNIAADAAGAVHCYRRCAMGWPLSYFSVVSFVCLDVKWETGGDR
jgi:hypothetical protein